MRACGAVECRRQPRRHPCSPTAYLAGRLGRRPRARGRRATCRRGCGRRCRRARRRQTAAADYCQPESVAVYEPRHLFDGRCCARSTATATHCAPILTRPMVCYQPLLLARTLLSYYVTATATGDVETATASRRRRWRRRRRQRRSSRPPPPSSPPSAEPVFGGGSGGGHHRHRIWRSPTADRRLPTAVRRRRRGRTARDPRHAAQHRLARRRPA